MQQPPEPLWDRFLKPIVSALLDRDAMQRQYEAIDWDAEVARRTNPQTRYPDYYLKNFHGIKGGYLTRDAAITYDPITRYVLPPSEDWIRADAIALIAGRPRRILDLGCGTGTFTLMLRSAFPEAEIVGLDLSPHMLALAADKARQADAAIFWQHGLAERTGLPAASYDLVTAGLLFHEVPPAAGRAILQEAARLLAPNGQFLALDGNQQALNATTWLTEIFEEPHIKNYAAGNLDADLAAAGLAGVTTTFIWGLYQVTCGFKPASAEDFAAPSSSLVVPA